MSKYIFILLFFCSQSYAFSGCWMYSNENSSYEINLKESNDKLSGSYCFINGGGNRIDCDKSASLIDGLIDKNSAFISFGGSGKGELVEQGGNLILKLIDSKPFDDFNMHIPSKIIFNKKKECE